MRFIVLKLRGAFLVFLGGMLGTLARFGMSQLLVPSWAATFTVNLAGALLMGLLIGAIVSRGDISSPRLAAVNALAGAGFLGGFTTYSALATDTLALSDSYGATGILIAASSALVGAILAGIGFAITHRKQPAAAASAADTASAAADADSAVFPTDEEDAS